MQRPKRPDELAREAAGVPPEPLGTVATTTGTVKYWREEKGYGVIASDATAPWDIWCHFMRIVDINKRLKLSGGDRSKGSGVLCPWRGTDFVPHPCAGERVARSLSAIR